jgi:hypothetical protein
MAIESFGTEREDIHSSKFQKYEPKTGQEDRVGIIPYEPRKFFKGAPCHFTEDPKRLFLCKSTKEKKEICCTHGYKGNRPIYRIGCVIIIYDLVKDKEGKAKLKSYTLLPWVFREKMYEKLVSADKEFSLDKYDIKLKCVNAEFKTIDVQSCNGIIWSNNADLKKKVLEDAQPLFEEMTHNIASDLGVTEIRELLGIDTPGAEDAATDINLGDVIEGNE